MTAQGLNLERHFLPATVGQRNSIERLEITWPSGIVDKLTNTPIDQIITVKEGGGIVPGNPPSPGNK